MEAAQTIMLGTFVRENPLIAAIAGTVVLALVVLIAGAVLTSPAFFYALISRPSSDAGKTAEIFCAAFIILLAIVAVLDGAHWLQYNSVHAGEYDTTC